MKKIDITPVIGLDIRAPTRPFDALQLNQRSLYNKNCFIFLNKEGELEDWNDPRYSKFWFYNLHYFDDLSSIDSSDRVDLHSALLDRWIDENPPAKGNGWEPYPISRRLVNWVKWLLVYGKYSDGRLLSLGIQSKVLMQTLETHLLGNHLFANAKALVFAGLFFKGKAADSWLEKGLKILDLEIPEQILADGGNFELWNDNKMKPKTIVSHKNRLVVMETNKTSWHSVSKVTTDRPRCCVSNYYFSKISPNGDDCFHFTSFLGRPEQPIKRLIGFVDNTLRNVISKTLKVGRG